MFVKGTTMNFFYGIKTNLLSSYLTIPRFKNNSEKDLSYKLFCGTPEEGKWKFEKVDCKNNDDFYFVENELINNEKIFFLAKEGEVKIYNSKLLELNYYTETTPAFRANLRIKNMNGGFSSYQSEYPHS